MSKKSCRSFTILPLLILLICQANLAQTAESQRVSGTVVTSEYRPVPGVEVVVVTDTGEVAGKTDASGQFTINIRGRVQGLKVSGTNIRETVLGVAQLGNLVNAVVRVAYIVPPISENVTITDDSLTPQIDLRNGALYSSSLFGRDDQIIQTLNAGINAGQHEGGGKSLEVRRYGFNLDHGGVNGGLKIVVDNVQQNQGTQGHGQGYLGSLKSLSPELVQDVSIINGPFSAAYGDFSGLGVVQIRQKESLPDRFTARLQGGSFNSFRAFIAYSPSWRSIDGFIAYEPSYTDGPFLSPLRYRRDNISANFSKKISDSQSIGIRVNFGRNNFFSSGQIPLDLVANGDLDRFGFIDPENGGRIRQGTAGVYYRRELRSGTTLKVDGFVARSLFDLFSNFTFYAADPVYGDEIQQHDSRLQQGANVQVLHPYKIGNVFGVVTAGANIHLSQINVGLYPTVNRVPNRKFLAGNVDDPDVLLTSALARVNNYAGYIQNELNLFDGHLRIETGLRFDAFAFDVNGFELSDVRTDLRSDQTSGKFQPKLSVALSPFDSLPISFYANYGRGISSQDARGVVRSPDEPKLSTTDFYQTGGSFNGKRVSFVLSGFLIDRSREQVYIPDDGSIELSGPTRSYGLEARTSVKITDHFSFNGGLTNVIRSFYRNQFTADGRRVVVDSSPRLVSNAGLILNDLSGFTSSLTWRHVSSYRLDGEDPSLRASGNDVVDLAISKRLKRWIDVSLSVDNLLDKKFYETQNYFGSRTCARCDLVERIHATPGFPLTVTTGVTFRFGSKK